MPSHEFSLSARDLDAGGKSLRLPVRAAWVRGALEGQEATTAGAEGMLSLRASKSGNDVVVHGELKAELTVPCARCMTPSPVTVDKTVSALFVPTSALKGSKGMDDEYEFGEGEADVLPFDGETVVLDDLIRDELILEVPMIPLCSEDCAGMSPGPAGVGSPTETGRAAVDPRLAPLLRLKLQDERSKKNH